MSLQQLTIDNLGTKTVELGGKTITGGGSSTIDRQWLSLTDCKGNYPDLATQISGLITSGEIRVTLEGLTLTAANLLVLKDMESTIINFTSDYVEHAALAADVSLNSISFPYAMYLIGFKALSINGVDTAVADYKQFDIMQTTGGATATIFTATTEATTTTYGMGTLTANTVITKTISTQVITVAGSVLRFLVGDVGVTGKQFNGILIAQFIRA